jgi:hypothetical protein
MESSLLRSAVDLPLGGQPIVEVRPRRTAAFEVPQVSLALDSAPSLAGIDGFLCCR